MASLIKKFAFAFQTITLTKVFAFPLSSTIMYSTPAQIRMCCSDQQQK